MDYNLASIRQRVSERLDDTELEASKLDNFINDTQRDIFNQFELPFQEKIFAGTLPASSTMFKMPEDLALLQRAVISGGKRTRDITGLYLTWRAFLLANPTPENMPAGDFEAWTSYAGNIILDRPMATDQTLTMYYIKKPKTLAVDADVPEIPEEFSELLVLGTYIRFLEHNEDFDQAAYVRVQYNNLLDMLVNRYGGRISPGSVKMPNRQIRLRRR